MGILRVIAAAGLVTAGSAVVATAAPGALEAAATAVVSPVAAIPVPGDRSAPAATPLTFRNLSPSKLQGITVVGSRSGLHAGSTVGLAGGGATFYPSVPFAGGESVTVTLPGVILGGGRHSYSFETAQSPTPSAAAAALRAAANDESTGASPTGKASRAATASPAASGASSTSCAPHTYHTAPTLSPPLVCMNRGVTTAGTTPGTYLFLTPGSPGIWDDSGNLVWFDPTAVPTGTNERVVQFGGQSYLAEWSGTATGFGYGVVNLYDEHYQHVGTVTAAGSHTAKSVDLHEFSITPQGYALFGIYDPVQMAVNGTQETVLQYDVQEVQLVHDAQGIHTGPLLFEWDSLTDVPVSQSQTPSPASGSWDYFHGNAIDQDTDGNLVVSARNTWGIYKIDDTPTDASFGHVVWEVGASGDNTLSEPWCYQHNIVALGSDRYSLYDDGGSGPGCAVGSTQHPARGLVITVDPSTSPAGVALDSAYTHQPPILSNFTGSTQVLPGGDVLVDWGDAAQVTEFDSGGNVKMDLSLNNPMWTAPGLSYRGFRYAWDGQPLTPPAISAQAGPGGSQLWVSWNGSTEVSSWQVYAGNTTTTLSAVGSPITKSGFETEIDLPRVYPTVAVAALNAAGKEISRTASLQMTGYALATSSGSVSGAGTASSAPAPGPLAAPAVGLAETADGGGSWVTAKDGGVFTFGDAHFYGSTGNVRLNEPVVGMAATPSGHGYWLVAADGGVFTFGDAHFFGSEGTQTLSSPIVGIADLPSGNGYWLAAADGDVAGYGTAAGFPLPLASGSAVGIARPVS
jgi:hypothetical protein